MKIRLLLFAFALIATACQSGKFSDNDFSGKTFAAKFRLDNLGKKDDPSIGIALAMLGNMKAKYTFNDDNTGTYRAEMGSISHESPMKWAVRNDSLFIETKSREGLSKQAFAIASSNEGYVISQDSIKVELVSEVKK